MHTYLRMHTDVHRCHALNRPNDALLLASLSLSLSLTPIHITWGGKFNFVVFLHRSTECACAPRHVSRSEKAAQKRNAYICISSYTLNCMCVCVHWFYSRQVNASFAIKTVQFFNYSNRYFTFTAQFAATCVRVCVCMHGIIFVAWWEMLSLCATFGKPQIVNEFFLHIDRITTQFLFSCLLM